MKIGIYSVKDELKGFGACICSDSDATAFRDFSYACNSNDIMKLNLKDYSLYKLGTFDTETGIISSDNPILIVDAASCVRKEKE